MVEFLVSARQRVWFTLALLLLGFFLAFSGFSPAQNTNKDSLGTIKGTVLYQGGEKRQVKDVIKDEHSCGSEPIIDESLLVSAEGGLQWSVVSIQGGLTGEHSTIALGAYPTLDQSTCIFKPHVILVGVDRPLVVVNSDKTLHNVRTVSMMNGVISRAQIAFPGSPVPHDTLRFKEPEVIEAVCDVHGWMKAFIHVVEHPFHSVTDANGGFELNNVPPGSYTLSVWHESLGQLEQKVQVLAGQTTRIEFSYKAKKK